MGNIRLSYGYDEKEAKVKIIEEDHYYPYGLKHARYNTGQLEYSPDEEIGKMELKDVPFGNPGMNKYKYNGKEWQDDFGLNMYAMDMRQYDPAIGRWIVQDPIVHHGQSPYNGYDGNPVFWADPSGGDVTQMMQDLWDATPNDGSAYTYAFSSTQETDDEESDYFASPEAEDVYGLAHEAGLTVGGWNQDPPPGQGTNSGYMEQTYPGTMIPNGTIIQYALDEVVILNNYKDKASDWNCGLYNIDFSIMNGFTMWGKHRGGDTSGLKGRTTDSYESDDFVQPNGGGG